MEGRILGVDLGTRRVGLAISDPLGITAQGLDTLTIEGDGEAAVAETVMKVAAVVSEREAVRVVVGLPINMDGSEGPAAAAARAFGEGLVSATGLPVDYWDERLTTMRADRELDRADVSHRNRKGLRDRMAAQFILQGYLAASGGPAS